MRLTVRDVVWRGEAGQLDGERPHISSDIEDEAYTLSTDVATPAPLRMRIIDFPAGGGDIWDELWTDPIRPDDREGIKAALVSAATRMIEGEDENCGGPPGGVTDSAFGRWFDVRVHRGGEPGLQRETIFTDEKAMQWAWAAYAAAGAPTHLPSIWAGHVWEAWGQEPGDEWRDVEYAGALYMRLTVRDVTWSNGTRARIEYDLDPQLIPRPPCPIPQPQTPMASRPLARERV